MRQQRRRDCHQRRMVAGAPQRLAASARGEPAGRRQNQKDLLVRAPGQGARDLFGSGAGIPGDCTRDRDIRLGRLDGDRKPWPATKGTGSNSRCSTHRIARDVIGDGNAPRAPRFIVLSQSGFHAVLGTLACLWSGRRSLMPNGSRTQVSGSEPSALAEIECRAKSDGEQSTPSIFQGHPRGFSLMVKDAYDGGWEWVEKPADSPLAIPAYLR